MEGRKIKMLFIQTVVIIAELLAVLGGFVVIVDPYQQYHRNENAYCGNQRREIAGVARHHDYNAFFTGSSMSMNHYPKQVDSLWGGWKTKNFSVMGATYYDYSIMLPYIIQQGKAKNIILNIDVFSFARDRVAVDKYLYDDNIFNDYEYLYNYTSLKSSIKYLVHPLPENDLYHFNSPHGRNELKRDYVKLLEFGCHDGEDYDYDKLKLNFDNSLLKVLRESDNGITWYIYYPPYSIAEFVALDKFGDLDDFLMFKDYSVQKLLELPNVRVFDFQVAPWITNLDEYMDVRHHSHAYNRSIMQCIHDDEYRIDDVSERMSDNIRELVHEYSDSLDRL